MNIYISKQAGANVILLFEIQVVFYLKIMTSLIGCFLAACKSSTSTITSNSEKLVTSGDTT
jgi:hypothetical protein